MTLRAFAYVFCIFAISESKVYFKEEFNDETWEKTWIQSEHSGKEFGKFMWTHGKFYGDPIRDKGIQTTQDARFYGLSTKFEPFTNKGKTLVVQFSVKHEQDIDCGGGYLKIFKCDVDLKDLHGDSDYSIMFGPDICGPGTKKVHIILNYKGKQLLINKEIRCKDDVFSHLYTLIIKPDNTYVVKIDNVKVEGGDLESHWDFLPPKKVRDPDAKKPEDWDDDPKLNDPEDKKPEDWDQPEYIPDPDAVKPEDWDDEMDGEWEPPQINNPAFKGEWAPRQIDNPKYKGPWIHPEIDNPEYNPDQDLYMFSELCAVGFDLWQVKSGTIFDNIFIGDDEAEAEQHGDDLWGLSMDPEHKMKERLDEEERKLTEEKPEIEEDDEDDDNAELSDSADTLAKPMPDDAHDEL